MNIAFASLVLFAFHLHGYLAEYNANTRMHANDANKNNSFFYDQQKNTYSIAFA
jgi:hypothetical protein